MRGVELQILGTSAPGDPPAAAVRVVRGLNFTGGRHQKPLDVQPLQINSTTPVRAQGETLYTRLASHPDVGQALQPLTRPTPDVEPLYLYIVDDTGAASALPWETLYFGTEFLALRGRRSIARVTETYDHHVASGAVTLSPQLKIMSVLSMLGAPAAQEWQALFDASVATRAARAAGGPGMDVEHLVLVGEPQLHSDIGQQADQHGFIIADTIPPRITELVDRIKTYQPQVLHLFCHGSADGRLQLGSLVDWEGAATGSGSLLLSLDELALAAVEAGVWLVVVNACLSGAVTTQSESLVEQLVRSGVPAAIGHRVLIQPADAHRFSRSLYEDLFRLFGEKTQAGLGTAAKRQEIEWAELLYRPRRDAVAPHVDPAVDEDWAVPILQVRDQDFVVEVTDQPQSAATESVVESTAREYVAEGAIDAIAHRPDTPQEVIDLLEQMRNRAVEPALIE